MTINDIKPGDIVVTRDKDIYIVFPTDSNIDYKDRRVFVGHTGFLSEKSYDNNFFLKEEERISTLDIIEVYRAFRINYLPRKYEDLIQGKYKLIFKTPETITINGKEYLLSEVEERLKELKSIE